MARVSVCSLVFKDMRISNKFYLHIICIYIYIYIFVFVGSNNQNHALEKNLMLKKAHDKESDNHTQGQPEHSTVFSYVKACS
jgi:hypothetical protein